MIRMEQKFAIIDIGSNTMRLVIYRHEKIGSFKEIENIKTVARLRNFLDENHCLNEEGMNLLIDTLKNYEEITNYHQVETVKAVATAAIRQAKNQQEILERIRANTNLQVKVLSEYEEAYYGFLAVVNSTSITEGITIDIGGGSTELTYFKDRKLIEYHSFPFGVLSLRQQFVKGDVPTQEELKQLSTFLLDQISQLEWLKDKKVPFIGIGGSARNIAQVDQRLKNYPLGGLHQYKMNSDDLRIVKNHLTKLTIDELKKVEGLSTDRADIIIPAVEVFQIFYQFINATSFILCRKGLRDGVFFEQLLKPYEMTMFPNVIEESLFELEYEYKINIDNAFQVSRLAVNILHSLEKIGVVSLTDAHFNETRRGAYLFHLGRYIDDEASSQHTFYLLANRTIDGIMHIDRLRLAAIASFKSKALLKQYIEPFEDWFSKKELHELRLLGAVLRFSYALNATKRNVVNSIQIIEEENNLTMNIICTHNWQAELYESEKQKRHLEKALKRKIILQFIAMK